MQKKHENGCLICRKVEFDYSSLDAANAMCFQATAQRIRDKVKRTVLDIIAIGRDLLAVKEALPHGQFGLWLTAEFQWTDRQARRFMDVANAFGLKMELISDLAIAPTAIYLLAAASASLQAREIAIQRAQAGERITAAIAREILRTTRKIEARKPVSVDADKLWAKLAKVLNRCEERWVPGKKQEFARRLGAFAAGLESGKRADRKRQVA